ncbi:MAG: hypothetical protein IMY72_01405 [Bacteroidetes bacterium]|nr:hypothetical protein [Bacteroidota bacterium]
MKKLILIFSLLFPVILFADNYTSVKTGDWTSSATWVGGLIPDGSKENTITISAGTIVTGTNLIFSKATEIIIEEDAELIINTLLNVEIDAAEAHKDFILNVLDGGSLTIDGNFTVAKDADLTIDGEATIDGNLDLGKGAKITVDLDGTTGGSLTVTGDLTAPSGEILGEGSVIVGGNVSGDVVGDDQINTLPIKLISFKAFLNNNQVIINWVTASEINNDYFSIERSYNGIDFEIIGIVSGAGNSNDVIEYQTIDNNFLQGISYYRLKQTDYDGQFEYSSLIVVKTQKETVAQDMNVFPNPVMRNFENVKVKIKGFNENEEVYVKVVNIFGKVEYSNKFYSGFDGTIDLSLDSDVFKSLGYHIINISSSNKSYSKRLLVK